MSHRFLPSAGLFCLSLALSAPSDSPSGSSGSPPPEPAPAVVDPIAAAPGSIRTDYRQAKPAWVPSFPSPEYFRQHFRGPVERTELRPPVRLQDFVVDGKLELSLRSYLELVMANNTDIEIQRLSVELNRNAITRAFGVFDPVLSGSFNATRSVTPANDVLAGAAAVSQLTQPTNLQYSHTLETGTSINAGFGATKSTTNSSFAVFNPAINANIFFGFTQPLLRNRGAYVTRLPVTLARSRLRSAEYTLRDQLMRLIATAENAYWDVVGSREQLRVQEKALELNDASLKRFRRELELGAISALEIFEPEATYASSEIQVTQARFRLQQTEEVLRRQMGADMDPDVRRLPIVLTEPVLPPTDISEIDRETTVEKALANRPDLKAILQNMVTDDLSIDQAANALRPDLSLTGRYVSAGRGGIGYQRVNAFGQSQVVSVIPGGFGDDLSQIFDFGFPTYQFGFTLRLPIRDRAAQANMSDAVVNKRLDVLRARSLEQNIRQDTLTAISQVESSKAGVRLAIVARDLAQKQLDAQQKRYDLGTTVIFFVLDAQTRLIQQESQLVNTSIQYRRNVLSLFQRTGELLEERGIIIQ